jgi:hypothetical protein
MSFNDDLGDVETQPDAGILVTGGVVNAIEALKNVIEMLRTDPHALVSYADQIVLFFVFLQAYHDLPSLWGVFDGIVKDITDYLADAYLVGANGGILRHDIQGNSMRLGAGLD